MRACCILLISVFAGLGVYAAVAAEFSEADLVEATTRQKDDIARLESALNTLEQKKRDAVKRIDRDAVKDLNAQIKDTKLSLSAAKKKTPDQYASELASERKLALEKAKETEQRAREAEQRRKEAAQAAEAELAATLAAKRVAEEQEAERKRLSGGCPIKIISGNFFHVDSEAIKQHPFCKSGFSEVGHLASMVR